ncbi:hypothetical protein ABN763_15365 [Spongiivirga sp. MCCC 1A20706]|uniref:hypothetical protein n=1 Tax=Spongiivirga sp. MCCC 1A20706 TaxID=3160963 RepID=UPI003977C17C
MKEIGIWLDKQKAYLLIFESNDEHFITIESEVEDYRIHGGSRSKTRWGPQDVVQDSKYLEREKHQLRNYFKKIIEFLKNANNITINGPAETYLKLKSEIDSNYRDIAEKVSMVNNADSMTINQVKALLKEQLGRAPERGR